MAGLRQLIPGSIYGGSNAGFGMPSTLQAEDRRAITIAAPSEKIEMYSPAFYRASVIGGILSCGLTHTMVCILHIQMLDRVQHSSCAIQVTPLDVVKCNMQTDPLKYPSISKGFGITVREQGYAGLIRGWLPTLVGYSIQGAGKFGLYEYFKKCASALSMISVFLSLEMSKLEHFLGQHGARLGTEDPCRLLQVLCRPGRPRDRRQVQDWHLPGRLRLRRILCRHWPVRLRGCQGIAAVAPASAVASVRHTFQPIPLPALMFVRMHEGFKGTLSSVATKG